MPVELIFILTLHAVTATISLVLAIREHLDWFESLRWCAFGFFTGLLGLITRSRVDSRHLNYTHFIHDSMLNLGMEVVALYGIPHFLK